MTYIQHHVTSTTAGNKTQSPDSFNYLRLPPPPRNQFSPITLFILQSHDEICINVSNALGTNSRKTILQCVLFRETTHE